MLPYACTKCQLRFTRRAALSKHLRSHLQNGVSDHKCSACDTGTSRHRTTYSCGDCGYVSNWKSNLTRHLRKNQCGSEMRSGRKPRSIQQSIPSEPRGSDKMEVNGSEAMIVCKQCNAGFKYQSELVRHHAISHESVKPYQCEFCDQGFNWKSNLTRHQKTQHFGTKPILCEQCGGQFFTKRQLNRHMKSHSDNEDLPERKCLRSQKKAESSGAMSPANKSDDEISGTRDLNDDCEPEENGPDPFTSLTMPLKSLRDLSHLYRHESSDEDDQGGKRNDSSAIRSADDEDYACESSEDDMMMVALRKSRCRDQVVKYETIDDDRIPMTAQLQVYGKITSNDGQMMTGVKRRALKRKSFALGKDPTLENIKIEIDDDFSTSPVQKKRGRRRKDGSGEGYCNPSDTLPSDDDDGKPTTRVDSFSSSIFPESSKDSDQEEGPFKPRQSAKTLNRMSLKRNGGMADPDRPVNRYPCSFCDRVFTRVSSHMQHERSHLRKPVFCTVCGKRFEKQSMLDKHSLIHTSKKSYNCGLCQQWFVRKSTLLRHMYVHGLGDDLDDYRPHGSDAPAAPVFTLEDTESGNDSDYLGSNKKIALLGNSGSHTYNTRFASKLERSEIHSGQDIGDCSEPAKAVEDPIVKRPPDGKDTGVEDNSRLLLENGKEQSINWERLRKKIQDMYEKSREKNTIRKDAVPSVETKDINDTEESQTVGQCIEDTKKTGSVLTQGSKHLIIHLQSKNMDIIRLSKSRIESDEVKGFKGRSTSVLLPVTKRMEGFNNKNVSFSSSMSDKIEETVEIPVTEPLLSVEDNNHVIKNIKEETVTKSEEVDLICSKSNEVTNENASNSNLEKLKENSKNAEKIPVDEINQNELASLDCSYSDKTVDKMDDDEVGASLILKKEDEVSQKKVQNISIAIIENEGIECDAMEEMGRKEEFEDMKSSESTEEVNLYQTEDEVLKETCKSLVDKIVYEQDVESILTDVRKMVDKIIESILMEPEDMNKKLGDSDSEESTGTTGIKKEGGMEEDKTFKDEAHKEKESENSIGPDSDVKEDVNEFSETDLKENIKEVISGDNVFTNASVIEAKSDSDSGLELDQITPSLVQTVEEAKQNETIYDDLELVKFEEIETEELKQVYDDAVRKSCRASIDGNRNFIESCGDYEEEEMKEEAFFPLENDSNCEMGCVSPLLAASVLKKGEDSGIYMELENPETSRSLENDDEKELGKNGQDENVVDDELGDGCKETEKDFQSMEDFLTGNLEDHDLICASLPSSMIQCEEVSTTDNAAIQVEDSSHQVAETKREETPTAVEETNKGSDGKGMEFRTKQGPSEGDEERVRPDENPKTESSASNPLQTSTSKSPQVKNLGRSEPPKKRGPKPGSSRKRKRRVPEIDNLLNPFNSISIEDGDFRKKILRSSDSLFVKGTKGGGGKSESSFNSVDTLSLDGIKQEEQRFPGEYVGYEKISIRQNIMVEQFIERGDDPRSQFQFGAAVPPFDGLDSRGVQFKKDRQIRPDRIQQNPFQSSFSPLFQNDSRGKLPSFNSLLDWKVPGEEKVCSVPGFREISSGRTNPGTSPIGFDTFQSGNLRKQPERDGFLGCTQQFVCNKCDRSFKKKEDMIRHRFTEHEKNCF